MIEEILYSNRLSPKDNSLIKYLAEKAREKGRLCTDSNLMIELHQLTDADILAIPVMMKQATHYREKEAEYLGEVQR